MPFLQMIILMEKKIQPNLSKSHAMDSFGLGRFFGEPQLLLQFFIVQRFFPAFLAHHNACVIQ